MNNLLFSWQENGSLAEQLARGMESISISLISNEKLIAITLWHGDGSGLRIRSKMHNIAERFEVGVLEFSTIPVSTYDEIKVILPGSFRGDLKLKKMIIVDSGIIAEAGVLFEGSDMAEIVVVAGADPYTLAVRLPPLVAAPSLPAFQPEYPIALYKRVAMQ
jgi:hypothetical protein